MVRLIVSGCNGQMGRVIETVCATDPELEIAAGIDLLGSGVRTFPVYSSPAEVLEQADVLVDFSSPTALDSLLDIGIRRDLPLVLATTGYSREQLTAIRKIAGQLPVFLSANMSLGVNVLLKLVRSAARTLGDSFDLEIVERHHNKKADAPSGTALMLADAAAEALPFRPEYIYDRTSVRQSREKREIGISSVRGGTIAGDHTVIFAGRDEVIELRHSAASQNVFAVGALRAARFLAAVEQPGLYSMSDLIGTTQATKNEDA